MALDGKSLQKYPVNAGAPQGSILGLTLFLLYINDLPDDVICNIAIYANDSSIYSKCDQASDLWQLLELASELESNLWDIMDWSRKWLVDFNVGKTLVLFDWSKNTVVLLMWKWIGPFLRKNYLLRCWGWLSLINLIGALTWPLLLKLLGVLIRSMKFLSPEVALYLYKSTIQPCMKYYCHAWASAPSCYLELLDKLHKRICKHGLIQDLNLGGRTNLVSFTVAINIVSDPRHAAEGSWAIL